MQSFYFTFLEVRSLQWAETKVSAELHPFVEASGDGSFASPASSTVQIFWLVAPSSVKSQQPWVRSFSGCHFSGSLASASSFHLHKDVCVYAEPTG